MNIQIGRKDAVWSFLGTVFAMGANLILLPFILHYLEGDSLALYYVFSSLSAIATLFDFGFSPSIARSMAYAWSGAESLSIQGVNKAKNKQPNFELMAVIVKTCKTIYFVLAITALILALTVGTYYVRYITRVAPKIEYIVAWVIYAFAIFTSLFFGYYTVFLRGVGAVSKTNMATVIARVIQIVLCVIFLISGMGLIGVAIAYLLYGMMFRILANIWFYKYENIGAELIRYKHNVTVEEITKVLKTIWPNTWRDGTVTVANYLLNQATTIIASLFLSLQVTGVFSLYVQLTSAIATIAGTLYTAYQPALQSAYANRNRTMQKKYVSLIVVSYVFAYILGTIVLLILGIPLIRVLRPSYETNIPLLLLIALYQFMLKFRNCYTTYISTTNRLIYAKSFVLSAVICVVLALLLTGLWRFQSYGLVTAQLISQLIYNVWHWPMVVHQELQLSLQETLAMGVSSISELVIRSSKTDRRERERGHK